MKERIAKSVYISVKLDEEITSLYGRSYGTEELNDLISAGLVVLKGRYTSEELKKKIKELKIELIEKMSLLPVIEQEEKIKEIKTNEELRLINRKKFLYSLYEKCEGLINKEKIQLFNLAIKENKYPELKEELIEQISLWGK